MAIRFGDAVKGFQQGQEFKRKKYSDSVDALVKEAQIKELGYDIQPGQGRFGPSLVERPGFSSLKQLQRQKLERELAPDYEANKAANKEKAILKARQEAFGGGGAFGTPNSGGSDQQQFIMDPSGKFHTNKNYQDPQLKKDQEESLRTSAEENLKTIGEVKKGLKYFGPMGNVPSEVAPSTIATFGGDYGPRKNWESNVNKLLSQKVLDVMTAMKKASKTGATGFGNLSNKELGILQNASTALNKGLTPDDAARYLNDIEIIHRKVLGGQQDEGGQNTDFNSPEEADASGLPQGTVVTVQGRKYQI